MNSEELLLEETIFVHCLSSLFQMLGNLINIRKRIVICKRKFSFSPNLFTRIN